MLCCTAPIPQSPSPQGARGAGRRADGSTSSRRAQRSWAAAAEAAASAPRPGPALTQRPRRWPSRCSVAAPMAAAAAAAGPAAARAAVQRRRGGRRAWARQVCGVPCAAVGWQSPACVAGPEPTWPQLGHSLAAAAAAAAVDSCAWQPPPLTRAPGCHPNTPPAAARCCLVQVVVGPAACAGVCCRMRCWRSCRCTEPQTGRLSRQVALPPPPAFSGRARQARSWLDVQGVGEAAGPL
jgi:hypothetical protein